MQIIKIIILVVLSVTGAYADSLFSLGGNNISTGQTIVDDADINNSYGIKGSGIVKKIFRKVDSFHSISSKGNFNIIYKNGPFSVDIMGDDNLIEWVSTKVVGNILMISMDKSYNTKYPLMVNISCPEVNYFNIVGTGNVRINDVQTDSLTIDLLGMVDVIVNGSTSKLWLHVQGSGDVEAKQLTTDFTNVYLDGSGNVKVTAKNELVANLNGSGGITYFGKPAIVKTDVFGAGGIIKGD